MVLTQASELFCFQIMRFTSGGQKPSDFVRWEEELIFPQYEVKGKATTAINYSYKLVASVVHKGANIFSGHYDSFVNYDGRWYCCDDLKVSEGKPFEATSEEAYLLFYEKTTDPEVQEIKTVVDGFGQQGKGTKIGTDPNTFIGDGIEPKYCIPPGYYKIDNLSESNNSGIYRTVAGSLPFLYPNIVPKYVQKAKDIAIGGIEIQHHPRVAAWDSTDIEKLLPANLKISDSLVSNFIIDKLFLIIEQNAKSQYRCLREYAKYFPRQVSQSQIQPVTCI